MIEVTEKDILHAMDECSTPEARPETLWLSVDAYIGMLKYAGLCDETIVQRLVEIQELGMTPVVARERVAKIRFKRGRGEDDAEQ